jgi:diguanylate cyclase (GGDEF)-like protein/PAS domain S-box-containing protein
VGNADRSAGDLALPERPPAARDAAHLERCRSLLQGVLSYTDALVYAKDLDGCFTLTNEALDRVLGVPVGTVVGRTDYDLMPAADADEHRRHDREVAGSGRREVQTERKQHRDGTWHDYLSAKFPLLDTEGRICAVGGMMTDVTELADQRRELAESERRWRSLVAASPIGIGLRDEWGCFITANPALCRLLGRLSPEVIGHHHREFARRPDADDPVSTSGIGRMELPFVRPDGVVRWGAQTLTELPGPAGERWVLAHIEDVTDRRSAVRATVDSEANLTAVAKVIKQIQTGGDARQTIVDATRQLAHATSAALVEAHPDGMVLWQTTATSRDLVGRRVALDAASAEVEAFTTGRPIFFSDPELLPLVLRGASGRGGVRSIYFVPVRSGEAVTAVLVVGWAERVAGLDDRRVGVVTLLADQAGVALRQSALLAELEALAVTDPLTLLPNRRGWEQRLTTVVAMAARNHLPLTIAIADLDHFKRFNDAHGHPAGDVLLRQFADAASGAIRAGDTMARWGGEEFALALPDCDAEAAVAVLERIRRALPGPETCSIGYATWDGSETGEDLVARADHALYEAKGAGRDRICAAGGL